MTRKRKRLTSEDKELWERVKRTATPLSPPKLHTRIDPVERRGAPAGSDAKKPVETPRAPERIPHR
jgi:DNA-nicking Smr family endonuclease